jgi:hypothetical protein
MRPLTLHATIAAGLTLAVSFPASAGVYKCTQPNGEVLYANAPCENLGAKTKKTFNKAELKPNSVKMPKAPPPPESPSDGPGGLIGSLRQKPVDAEQLIREGDPDSNPRGGVRHPVLEKMMRKK